MEKQETSLAVVLQANRKELAQIAPKYINIERMIALALEARMRNPLLAESSAESVLNFCKKCAEAGTDRIGAGGMWAVPFKNGKTGKYDMTPIPDWRLIVEKAKKAKAIKHATAVAVYENDTFEYEYGLDPKLTHIPAKKNPGELSAVYCVYVLPDGTKDFVVMSWSEVEAIRNRTNAWKSWINYKHSNPWVTDPAEQAKKTVIKRALKVFEGASPELTKLIETDNVVNGFELALPEPIAEPKAIETTATEIPPKEKKPEGNGEIPPEAGKSQGNPLPATEPPAEEKRKPGRPPKEMPAEEGMTSLDYADYVDEKGSRIKESTESKICINPKCSSAGRKILCGKVTGLCIPCLRKASGKFNV